MVNQDNSSSVASSSSQVTSTSGVPFEQLIKQYNFKIEAVFDHVEARETFRNFLKKDCLNEEPFIFYEAVEQYNKTRLGKNRFELAHDIIDKFIMVGSLHELNLSMNDRKELLKRWKEVSEKNEAITNTDLISCPIDLFNSIQDVLFIELKVDNFPRFIASDMFKKFLNKEMKKNDLSILEKLGTKKPSPSITTNNARINSIDGSGELGSNSSIPISVSRSSVASSSSSGSEEESSASGDSTEDKIAKLYENDELMNSSNQILLPIIDELNPYVSELDYQLVLKLLHSLYNDNSWKSLGEKVGMKTCVSPPIYCFNSLHQNSTSGNNNQQPSKSTNRDIPKFMLAQTGIMPGMPRDVVDIFYGEHVQKFFNDMYKRRFQVDYFHMNPEKDIPFPTSIVYAEISFPFPFTNRDCIYAKSIIPDQYDPSTGQYNRYTMIMNPTSHHEYPAKSNPVRAIHYLVYVAEKYTKSSVRYAAFDVGDMGGKIPPSLASSFMKTMAKILHKKSRKAIEQGYESHSLNVVKDHDGGLATLKEYEEYLEKVRLCEYK
ncbi:hypothetical protein C9374_011673 [Naegleria lovaniensis]|uniref:RGS domain-containing protein n=1 Tax=Naegleria lovaniensis TaxID=51637 RepID=A0AA88GFM6_NAELO|nr:uncharacterized protein C9374_011673 [Naegleria lovaniensis]KAG2374008.1 hypothetical protein C9374_011673 [Naegleria lovaniensis]